MRSIMETGCASSFAALAAVATNTSTERKRAIDRTVVIRKFSI